MTITRRDFLESGIGSISVLGFSLLNLPGIEHEASAAEAAAVADIPVVWLSTGSCTGCSVGLLNSASPTIQEALLGQILPGKHLSLRFHATIMAASGSQATDVLDDVMRDHKGGYVLVVEGAIATKEDGAFCGIGESGHKPMTGYERARRLGTDALAVLAVGACSAFGGIPAADPNPTGAISMRELMDREKIKRPLVNIPGCPPHPDWVVGSIAAFLLGGAEAIKLDSKGRPGEFFSEFIHDICPYRGSFERGRYAEHFGERGCLYKLGCKGPVTRADCPTRKFNNGTSWCVEAGHPCIGCCNPSFPFKNSMFAVVSHAAATGQALDENHAGESCTACHVDNRVNSPPKCDGCHDVEDGGITFPARRPGPLVGEEAE